MELPCTLSLILLISWFLLLSHQSAAAQRSTYIVHMDKSSMPKAFSSHHYWYSSILESAKSESQLASSDGNKLGPKLLYAYDNAFHGFSAVVSKDELKALKKSRGFLTAYEDGIVTPDTTHSYKFLSLNTVSGLWPESEYGKDVIIGVVDSGLWPESPSFKDDGMTEIPARWKGKCQEGEEFNSSLCNKKLIGAQYFNAGVRALNPGVTITMNSARDNTGHGTHCASIAAGNYVEGVSYFGYAPGTARGVAPRARLAIYKVLWSEGSLESDALAGIDQAVADGVDVLSISLSYRRNNVYEDPLAIAGFGAREKGIIVSVSAGNVGSTIVREKGIIMSVPWAIMVAAGTVDRWFAGIITLGNGKSITGWSTFPGRASIWNLPIIYNETLSACNSTTLFTEIPFPSILICDQTQKTTEFSTALLMYHLTETDIAAAIIISEDPFAFRTSWFPHPAVVISPSQATADFIKYASNSSGTQRATIDFQKTILGTEPRAAPAVADFSSKGPARTFQGILKPDIMAPGTSILAAYNPHVGTTNVGRTIFLDSDYTLFSGTSTSCPHISGIAALLKAVHRDWSPAAIQSAMMTTASQLDNTKQPIKDAGANYEVATPLAMGAGHVDPNRALDPGLIYDATPQDFANLVCAMNFTREQTQTVIRSGYNCSNPSMDLNYPSFIALYNFDERDIPLTRKFQRTVTNVGNGAATYRVKLETPAGSTVKISPKVLVFQKKYEKRSYSLTIRYRSSEDFREKAGSVTWVDDAGKYTVRSPLVVSPGWDNFH
ncbi:subtilisin-like protease SBT3 [Henckelia pumila]|uniref:subtilisin-like protease SBT3 n=1 Tax=Henckelia pumila TaxID=405737 RepID=UPI003C6DD388